MAVKLCSSCIHDRDGMNYSVEMNANVPHKRSLEIVKEFKINIMEKYPLKKVTVKVSYCTKCNGFVTASALHLMDSESLNRFEKEVEKYKLAVKHIPLTENAQHVQNY